MGNDLLELWAFLKGVSIIGGLIAMIGAAISAVILVKIKGFQSVRGVEELKESLERLREEVHEGTKATIGLRGEFRELTAKVEAVNRITGEYVEAVGRYTESSQHEVNEVRHRLNLIERDGCAAYRAKHPGNGDG
jgi:predicted nuclease with TOPRIM domain